MIVYVATKFQEQQLARATMAALRYDGHVIAHDWTTETLDDVPEGEHAEALKRFAEDDVNGVAASDAVLLRVRPQMEGAWAEVGMAAISGKPVVIVDEFDHSPDFIFQHLPHVHRVRSLKEGRAMLRVIETKEGE